MRRTTRIPCLLLMAALVSALCAMRPAAAEDLLAAKVPALGNATLPVAGTGAPMARTQVTHVMVGELGYYRLADMRDRVITRTQLREVLRRRAGATRPSPHEVWITATGQHIWAQVRLVRLVCQDVGIYRVGLRVRHDSKPVILGFPLFLPSGDTTRHPGRASRLPLTLEARAAEPSSDPRILYQAAKRAREKYKQDVVAEVRIHNNLPIQTVLTSLDMLYRAGCIGVAVKSLRNVPTTVAAPYAAVRIVRFPRAGDVILPPKPIQPLAIPPVLPRTAPWPISGANQPGALGMELDELPIRGEARPHIVEDPSKPLPFYLRQGEVPPADLDLADRRLRAWSHDLGQELLAGIRRDGRVKRQIVVRLRELKKLSAMMTPIERAFRDAQRIRVRTVTLDVLLSQAGRPLGLYELELLLTTPRVSIIGLKRLAGEIPAGVNLPPEAVDPYAAGTPGRVRVWTEGQMAAARRGGIRALPLASPAEIVAGCPAARRAALERRLAGRTAEVQRAVASLRAGRFDRAYITLRGARMEVFSGNRPVGEIELGIEAEEGELRINAMTAHRSR